MGCEHIYDVREQDMSGAVGAGSAAARTVDAYSVHREYAIRGLEQCLTVCTDHPSPVTWEEIKGVALASFARFMEQCQHSEPSWAEGMQETMNKFVAGADLVLVAASEKVFETMRRMSTGIPDEDRRIAEAERVRAHRQKLIEQTIEQYMLLVNASLLLEPWRAYQHTPFEYMHGIEFPGLWSRVLYADATPNKIYRNMLVGNRPRGFSCDADATWDWTTNLQNIRRLINHLIPAADRSLLSEYATNLHYAMNFFRNEDEVRDPPAENYMSDVDTWSKPADPGHITYDVASANLILPSFLGTPCGVVFRQGYLYMLTTDGEIFRLQISHLISHEGALANKPLISDPTKCIVEHPNKCVIKRVHFEKGTPNFPALVSIWDSKVHLELMPTCLVAAPLGRLFVVSARLKAIYEISLNFGRIKVHAGKPDLTGDAHMRRVLPAFERGVEHNRTWDTLEFRSPTCAVFDANNNLWVCDGTWLRQIKYETGDATGKNITVSNEVNLGVYATCMALGQKGFVVVEHDWSRLHTRYEPRLWDVQFLDGKTAAGAKREIRKSTTIKRLGVSSIGSIIVDSRDQILFCPRRNIRCVDRSDYQWVSCPEPIPYRENEEGVDDVYMKDLLIEGGGMCYLTWFLGNILLFTESKDKKPIMTVLSKQRKQAAAGAAEGDTAGREVRPRTAGRGRGAGGALPLSTDVLLRQLAEVHLA